ncbi:lytic transglycosylase domain-containing protein [Erythrobacter litoralis]|uniref:lytic transglycosylase domain-containing protein n=1 Tax=Erythrobacter litoralis TaxID=39960 RepID=UPI002434841B|nr:lytic transglycosylase domain-containing protein [Erythrobacter litoralis]MDG6077785.1 lytic transglycosylase domain-containing protein [Erythrobacter litoralis]
MIRGHIAAFAIAAIAVCSANHAKADVLEITDDGARWVAGGEGQAVEPLQIAQSYDDALSVDVPADVWVPDHIVADPDAHALSVPELYRAKVAELSKRFDLSPTLIEAMVWQESRWQANAVSPVGARGLAQLMPGTARDLGVDPSDPFANLEGGARYLRAQLDRFDGDLEKALAAYNAGPGRVMKANGIPRIRETQLYVASIMGRLSNYSRSGS